LENRNDDGSDRASAGMDPRDLLIALAARLNRVNGMVLSRQSTRLTFRQYRTLVRVREGNRSMSQLAARSNLSLPTVSENVDGLIRRGLLTAAPSSLDRRVVVLEVTEEGARAAEEATRALRAVAETVTAGLSELDKGVLDRAIALLYDEATTLLKEERGD